MVVDVLGHHRRRPGASSSSSSMIIISIIEDRKRATGEGLRLGISPVDEDGPFQHDDRKAARM